MSRLLLIPLLTLCAALTGCGEVFVGFVSNPGNPVHVSGTVTVVQLQFISDGHGSSTTFTAVTLLNASTLSTFNFCGDQRTVFPVNQFVIVDFNTGIYCSTLIRVTVSQSSGS